MTLTNNQHTNV